MQNLINMKASVLQALRSTFIADSQKLKETNNFLTGMSRQQGYCMTLMDIIDDSSLQLQVKQAALVQLKNSIKRNWKAKQYEICQQEKTKIKQIILVAFIRCSNSLPLIKLYKQIVTIIIGHEYKSWIPIQPIIQKIRADQDLISIMHIVIAISTSFQFSITEQQRNYFFAFLKEMLPEINKLRLRNSDPELIYLIVKFIWKSVHYQINQDIKVLSLDWMDLIANVVNLNNPNFDNNIDQPQKRNTNQFYYFHAKKWATRILLRFIQKHAKATVLRKNQKNKEFSDHWYSNYSKTFLQILIYQFSINNPKKVRYFQIKCIQAFISQKPNEISNFAKIFQQQILLKFIRLQPQDEEIAKQDPLQFLLKESQPSISFTNLKRVATEVWIAFAELGSQPQKKGQPYKPGMYFYQNMKYLKEKLEGTNMIDKQMAMYLICQLRTPIMRCKAIKQQLPNWISKYIIPEFLNPIMFLRARAVDIFFEYGTIQLSYEVISKATEGIYKCLMSDQFALVRIKAGCAFNCILKHKNAKDLVKPLLQSILGVYLQLLQKYDLQSLVNSLESIIQGFSTQIGPFASQLGKYLAKLFVKMFQKDITMCNNDDYDGQAQLAAAGCLKTFTQIIDAPISQESLILLETQVIQLCEFIFSSDTLDYTEDILTLLSSYLHKIDKITPQIWFYYQVVVYNIVGIPQPHWQHINILPITETQKKILNNLKNSDNVQMMEQSMPVIRNFIRKGSANIISNQDPFKVNLLQLLFYLINEVYKKGPNEFTGQIEMMCCTALLIYLIQNNKDSLPEMIFTHVLKIAEFNIRKTKSKTLKVLNSQLLGLLLWVNTPVVLGYMQKQNILGLFLKQLLSYEQKYEQEHQRQRLILGLSTLIKYPERSKQIIDKFPLIFTTLIKLVKKNAEQRIDDEDKKILEPRNFEDIDDEDEDLDNIDLGSQDDEQFWEQMYNENYSSPLDLIDQVDHFQKCILQIKNEQNDFYNQMIKIVKPQELGELDNVIQKSKACLQGK